MVETYKAQHAKGGVRILSSGSHEIHGKHSRVTRSDALSYRNYALDVPDVPKVKVWPFVSAAAGIIVIAVLVILVFLNWHGV